ncbi:sulfotransferase domain superfamily [hydrocarbon metagenome]|uniref:Sulfotransferase domain superfamily n=1 Tax=hydrocarbon metagenome TaxID=938273 RepID=A0A0W8FSP5_9ZZZZ
MDFYGNKKVLLTKTCSSKVKNKFLDTKQVFIGGCPRSGTTMLGSILGSADDCVVTPESQFKHTIQTTLEVDWNCGISKQVFLSALRNNFRFKLWDIPVPESDLADILNQHDYRMILLSLVDCYANIQGKQEWTFWIDHTPENIKHPLVLLNIFPEAKFIHIVRDPRAVAASVLPLDWGPFSARQAAFMWVRQISYGQALERMYPDKCIRVYYEDILVEPEKTIQNVCNFCGINFKITMLKGEGYNVPVYSKKQHALVGSWPEKSRLNAWQENLDIWQVAQIEGIVADLMILMGYEKYIKGTLPKRPLKKIISQRLEPLISYFKKKKRL